MRPSAALVALAFCVSSMAAQTLFAQQPEDVLEPLEEELPQVTIVKRGGDTITEFRLRGKLYMVKVTPENGVSYYLIDQTGNGQWVRNDDIRKLVVPSWVLTSW